MRMRDLFEDSQIKKFYHVTPEDNLPSIMSKGIIPTVGERSAQLDDVEAVFLFHDIIDIDDAVTNWLGDEFDEDANLVCLEVSLSVDDPNIVESGAGYETMYTSVIPPERIKLLGINLN